MKSKLKLASLLALIAVPFYSGLASATTAQTITDSFTSANSNLSLVVSGVIALVAIVTGVGLIVKFMSR